MISLPIDEALPALRQALQQRDEAVLEAPPGAGRRRPGDLRRIPRFAKCAGSRIVLSEKPATSRLRLW
jgi:ATP-dependent helicase HrpB